MIYTLIRKDANDAVDAILSFDSIRSMDESWSATVTNQTVESGFNITDNISIEPPTYDIDAIISSYSLFDKESEITWDGEQFQTKSDLDGNRHIKARDEIIRIFKERSILTLLESSANSSLDNKDSKYEELKSQYFKETNNCVITSLSISHPDSGGGAFYVSLKVQKVHVAIVTTTELLDSEMTPALIPLIQRPKEESSKTKKDKGDDDFAGDVTAPPNEETVVAVEPIPAGRSQADFERYRAGKVFAAEYKLSAIRQAEYLAATDGIRRKVVKVGNTWEIQKIR